MIDNNFPVKLEAHISTLAPNTGVRIVNPNDRSTWQVKFKDEATDQQKADANAALLVFDPTAADQAKADRLAAIAADVAGDTFAQAVDSATPNQIRTFIQNNVNNLADAKTFLAKLTMLVADTRRK